MLIHNELIFIIHCLLTTAGSLVFARIGQPALTAYVACLFIMANIFVVKQITLCGFTATAADAFIVSISFSINLLQEFWSRSIARHAVLTSLAINTAYMIIVPCILAYIPATDDVMQPHMIILFHNTLRIIMASLVAYGITQCIDIYIYSTLKKLTNNRYFMMRNYITLCICQLVDTVLFSYLGLYGIIQNIYDIMIVSYIIKLFAIALATPTIYLTYKIIKPNIQKK